MLGAPSKPSPRLSRDARPEGALGAEIPKSLRETDPGVLPVKSKRPMFADLWSRPRLFRFICPKASLVVKPPTKSDAEVEDLDPDL